jgi:CelD/BcsL family acetyltransferase involved in cellulose biosynthesis
VTGPGETARRLEVACTAGADALERLRPAWARLVAAMPEHGFPHLLVTHAAYAAHLPSPYGPPTYLTLRQGDDVLAIVPLEPEERQVLGRRMRVLGLPLGECGLPRDLIAPPGLVRAEILPAVLEHLRVRSDAPTWLVLGHVLEGSTAWSAVQCLDRRQWCSIIIGGSDVLDCARPFGESATALSRNFRGNLRKARNKLAALADVAYVHAAAPAALEREFAAFLAVEASGWKGRVGTQTAIRLRAGYEGFFRALLAGDGEARCEINALYAEGRCLASQFCMRVGAEYWVLKIGYDESYSRVAPGQLLLERVWQRCCEDPAVRRLSLVSDAAWHRDWRPDRIPVHRVYIAVSHRWGPALVALLRQRLTWGPRLKRRLLHSRVGTRLVRLLGGDPVDQQVADHASPRGPETDS